MQWLDKIDWKTLTIVAVLLALAPITSEPHLIEKLKMLGTGNLRKPLDIFDLLMHSAPIFLVGLKAFRQIKLKN